MEQKGKEQIDRRREKWNDDFKILGDCSDGPKHDPLVIVFGLS